MARAYRRRLACRLPCAGLLVLRVDDPGTQVRSLLVQALGPIRVSIGHPQRYASEQSYPYRMRDGFFQPATCLLPLAGRAELCEVLLRSASFDTWTSTSVSTT